MFKHIGNRTLASPLDAPIRRLPTGRLRSPPTPATVCQPSRLKTPPRMPNDSAHAAGPTRVSRDELQLQRSAISVASPPKTNQAPVGAARHARFHHHPESVSLRDDNSQKCLDKYFVVGIQMGWQLTGRLMQPGRGLKTNSQAKPDLPWSRWSARKRPNPLNRSSFMWRLRLAAP